MQLIFACLFLVFLIYLVGRIVSKPFRLIFKVFFNSLFGLLLLWGYNFIGNFVGVVIPINYLTVLISGFLGIPGLIMLIILNFILGG